MDFAKDILGKLCIRLVYGPDSNIPKSIVRKRKENAPRPLPNTRARTLSISDDQAQKSRHRNVHDEDERNLMTQQHLHSQTQHSLLLSLPPEIRVQIWRYVIALSELHIVRARKKLWAIQCARVSMAQRPLCCHDCWGISDRPFVGYHGTTPGYCHSTRGYARFRDGVPLLQACRLVYLETVNILYQENTFLFNHVDTIICLSRTTIPSRFQSIRKLRLAYNFPFFMYRDSRDVVPPYDAGTWNQTCLLLASISGLKYLYIHLGGWNLPHEIHDILRPLHRIRQTDVFDVYLSIGEDPDEAYQIKDKPFRFVSETFDDIDDGICC